jgi:hypothetical protein
MGLRGRDRGASEGPPVIGGIGVEPPGDITPRETGLTSPWSSVTREPWPTDLGRKADMSAAATLAGAPPRVATDWHSINWKKVYRNVRRLQARIVKALREGKWNKVKALVYLLTHAYSGRALAILRVTTNRGASTPGVDGITWNTPETKTAALDTMRSRGYTSQPLRRVHIPKSNGKKRALGIPMVRAYCTPYKKPCEWIPRRWRGSAMVRPCAGKLVTCQPAYTTTFIAPTASSRGVGPACVGA